MGGWKIRRGEQDFVDTEIATLKEWALSGKLTPEDVIFHPLLGRWMYVRDLEELVVLLEEAERPSPRDYWERVVKRLSQRKDKSKKSTSPVK